MKLCKKSELWIYIIFTILSLISLIVYLVLNSCGISTSVKPLKYIIVFILIWLPLPVLKILKFDAPLWVSLSYQIFIVLSFTLLSVWGGYTSIKYLDFVVHGLSGIIISSYTYSYFTQKNGYNSLNAIWVFVLIFAVAVACGAIWEIGEYVHDAFGGNAQFHTAPDGTAYIGHQALTNTIFDLISDTIGALISSIICICSYNKNKKARK